MSGTKPHWMYIALISVITWSCGSNKNINTSKTIAIKAGYINLFNDSAVRIYISHLDVMKYEVTNKDFTEFIKKTGYITSAEKNGASMVFDANSKEWIFLKGANWKHPKGKGSTINGKDLHPVVHVSYSDACAYCEWMNMRLPYESEWEYFETINGKDNEEKFNSWQGIFPNKDEGTDGFRGTSPVGNFSANENALSDLKGNVWEWCMDYYHPGWPEIAAMVDSSTRIYGPVKPYSENEIYDTLRIIKGGSYLCSENYCVGYKGLKRQSADPKLSYEHVGFRCVK